MREIERQIQQAEKDTRQVVPPIEKPSGIPETFAEYLKLMYDLQVIAFQADLTRVATLMVGREGSLQSYPEIGVPDPHHPLTHHQNNPEWIEKVARINVHHLELFAHFVARLKATPDGDGTLLDHSMVVYGSAIADGNKHTHEDLPVLLAGRGGGAIKTGRHVVVREADAADQPVPDAARPHGRAPGDDRRQHRPHRAPDRHLAVDHCGCSRPNASRALAASSSRPVRR